MFAPKDEPIGDSGKQLVMAGLEEPDFEKWSPITVSLLKRYFNGLENIRSWQFKIENTTIIQFDSGTRNYGDSVRGYSDFISSTEKNALRIRMKLEENIEKTKSFCTYFEQMLEMLDHEERVLLEIRYMKKKPKHLSHEEWFLDLGLPPESKATFYRRCETALKKLIVLGEPYLLLMTHDSS